jgi:hypothetical protein
LSNVKISAGNAKLGSIPSVSLSAGETCRKDCECFKKCYAQRIERRRPSVREAYKHNLTLLRESPDIYWREVEASIMMSRFFRFHVSGDIPDNVYFAHMVDIAERNQHCEILCFTKKYNIINEYLEFGGKMPQNLHIVFSGWKGLKMDNPYLLPEAHVRYKDGTTTANPTAKECGGNCTECVLTEVGCWTLKPGEQVVFNEH